MLLLTVGMLDTTARTSPTRCAAQYRWFTVDEYQDVNPLQQRLLELWLGERDELCVVGDASQTIYTFTGRLVGVPAGLPPHLPARHRGTAGALLPLDAAGRRPREQGARPRPRAAGAGSGSSCARPAATAPRRRCTRYDDEPAEAAAVARRIKALLGPGTPAREIAVLYRINAQSEVVRGGARRGGGAVRAARGVGVLRPRPRSARR